MVMMNSFDLLGDVDMEDPSQLVELLQQKINSKKSAAPVVADDEVSAAKIPSKPLPPSQAVQERREGYSGPRDGGRGRGGRGSGFGGRNSYNNENYNGYTPNDSELEKDSRNVFDREHGTLSGPGSHKPIRDGYSGPRDGGRGGAGRGRGGRGSGFGGRNSYNNDYTTNDSEFEKDSRNVYDREHGMLSGPGSHNIRDGRIPSGNPFHNGDRSMRISNRWGPVQKQFNGKGNWTSPHDQPEEKCEDLVVEVKEIVSDEKVVEQSDAPASEANKESAESKTEEEKAAEAKKAEEDKERSLMTLEEYEKVLEKKRKALVAMKAEERKVELDKAFESMQLLSLKKGKDEIFVKLVSDKDSGKQKDDADREEKVKKSVSITEFLKPAEGERRNYRSGGGRRDRGQGDHGATGGVDRGNNSKYARSAPAAPSIADVLLFPSLGGK